MYLGQRQSQFITPVQGGAHRALTYRQGVGMQSMLGYSYGILARPCVDDRPERILGKSIEIIGVQSFLIPPQHPIGGDCIVGVKKELRRGKLS